MSEKLGYPFSLRVISQCLESWMTFDKAKRDKEGLETDEDTHIIAPPHWPSHGQLTKWVEVLDGAATRLRVPHQWQPIETAPDGDFTVKIDMWSGSKRFTDCYWGRRYKDEPYGWIYESGYVPSYGPEESYVPDPSHWMPLPEPPEEG